MLTAPRSTQQQPARRRLAVTFLPALLLVAIAIDARGWPASAAAQAASDAAAASAAAARSDDPGAERVARRHGFAPQHLGYLLFDPVTGRVLAEHRAGAPFLPASTTKVATALAALEVLGDDHRFATTVLGTGGIAGGTLAGDLYLHGGGDPTLDTEDLRRLAATLRAAGVERVAGAFYFDESLFPRATEIDLLQPEAATYNPAVSALAINFNRLVLSWKRSGDLFSTSLVSPADGGAIPVDGVATGRLAGAGDPRIRVLWQVDPEPRWLLSPSLPARGSLTLPVKGDPGRVAAGIFRDVCRQAGVELPEPKRGDVPAEARELARHRSEPLDAIAEGLLRYSNNLTAELVGLATSRRLTGTGLSLHQSATLVGRWWQDRLPEVSFEGFAAANHSGLSTQTRHSPEQLAAFLRAGYRPGATARFPDLLRSMDVAHEAGGGKDPGMDVRAKTGTLAYADGLAGFLAARDGRELGFVVLLTDFERRAQLDASRDVRVNAAPPAAADWTARAKALERELVSRWARGGS